LEPIGNVVHPHGLGDMLTLVPDRPGLEGVGVEGLPGHGLADTPVDRDGSQGQAFDQGLVGLFEHLGPGLPTLGDLLDVTGEVLQPEPLAISRGTYKKD
jgi:hypothetical protein